MYKCTQTLDTKGKERSRNKQTNFSIIMTGVFYSTLNNGKNKNLRKHLLLIIKKKFKTILSNHFGRLGPE